MEKDILLMLLNIESLLGGGGKINKDKPEAVIKKINNINKFMLDYMKSDKQTKIAEPSRKMGDFKVIKERLSSPLDQDKLDKFLSELPPEVDHDMAAVAVAEILPKLKSIIPINTSVTLTGIDERVPSDYEQSKFIRQVRILEDPLSILGLIEANAVTGTEIDALKMFYPAIYEALVGAIVNALADLAGKHPDSPATLPLAKNRTLSLIMGIPRVSPAQMQVFQKQEQSEGDKAELQVAGQTSQTEPQRVATK